MRLTAIQLLAEASGWQGMVGGQVFEGPPKGEEGLFGGRCRLRYPSGGLIQVKQHIQSFIFGINAPSRWGSQAPFTNITLDWTVPEGLRDEPAIVGGEGVLGPAEALAAMEEQCNDAIAAMR